MHVTGPESLAALIATYATAAGALRNVLHAMSDKTEAHQLCLA